jgi:hypothetical protein
MDINNNFLVNQRRKVKFFNCYIIRNFIKNNYLDGVFFNGIKKLCKNELREVGCSFEFIYKAKLILKTSELGNNHTKTNLNDQQKSLIVNEILILKFLNQEKNQTKLIKKNFTSYNSIKILSHQGKFFIKNNSISWNLLSSIAFKQVKNIKSNKSLNKKIKIKKKSIDFLSRIIKIFQGSFKLLFYFIGLNHSYFRIKEKIIYKYF